MCWYHSSNTCVEIHKCIVEKLVVTVIYVFFLQTCDIRASHQRGDQVIVSVVFSNLTDHTIKDLEFNVMDTMNLKLIRSVSFVYIQAIYSKVALFARIASLHWIVKLNIESIFNINFIKFTSF